MKANSVARDNSENVLVILWKTMNRISWQSWVISTFTLFALLIANGCATTPTPEQLAHADWGSYPEDYQEIVKAYYSQSLYDPYSAHYRWIKGPYRGYFSLFGKFEFGYIVHVALNAKNRMGGYVGEQKEVLLIKNGKVVGTRPGYQIRD